MVNAFWDEFWNIKYYQHFNMNVNVHVHLHLCTWFHSNAIFGTFAKVITSCKRCQWFLVFLLWTLYNKYSLYWYQLLNIRIKIWDRKDVSFFAFFYLNQYHNITNFDFVVMIAYWLPIFSNGNNLDLRT